MIEDFGQVGVCYPVDPSLDGAGGGSGKVRIPPGAGGTISYPVDPSVDESGGGSGKVRIPPGAGGTISYPVDPSVDESGSGSGKVRIPPSTGGTISYPVDPNVDESGNGSGKVRLPPSKEDTTDNTDDDDDDDNAVDPVAPADDAPDSSLETWITVIDDIVVVEGYSDDGMWEIIAVYDVDQNTPENGAPDRPDDGGADPFDSPDPKDPDDANAKPSQTNSKKPSTDSPTANGDAYPTSGEVPQTNTSDPPNTSTNSKDSPLDPLGLLGDTTKRNLDILGDLFGESAKKPNTGRPRIDFIDKLKKLLDVITDKDASLINRANAASLMWDMLKKLWKFGKQVFNIAGLDPSKPKDRNFIITLGKVVYQIDKQVLVQAGSISRFGYSVGYYWGSRGGLLALSLLITQYKNTLGSGMIVFANPTSGQALLAAIQSELASYGSNLTTELVRSTRVGSPDQIQAGFVAALDNLAVILNAAYEDAQSTQNNTHLTQDDLATVTIYFYNRALQSLGGNANVFGYTLSSQ